MAADERTRGERAADRMKAVLATWTALCAVLVFISAWVVVNPAFDRFPYVLLNLCLSCFAALQCFVLLIANKRGEALAEQLARSTHENTLALRALLEDERIEVHHLVELEQRLADRLDPSAGTTAA